MQYLQNINAGGFVNYIQPQVLNWQAMDNARTTINGLSKVVDNLNIGLFPDLVELIVNSKQFIRTVATNKIDLAYRQEPLVAINNDNIDPNLITDVKKRTNLLMSRRFDIKHPLGNFTPFSAILEAIKLAERHGGSLMLMLYQDEKLEDLKNEIDPNNIDTTRKLMFYPIALTSGNQATAHSFLQNIITGKTQEVEKVLKQEQGLFAVKTEDILFNKTVNLRLLNGGTTFDIHTSRLTPLFSGIKNYSTNMQFYGWDNSVLQGALRAISNYYIFIDTIPEMLREKILNKVSIAGLDYMNLDEYTHQKLTSYIKSFAESASVNNYGFFPQGTEVVRDNLRLDDLNAVQQILERQIVMETDMLLMDITGEGASGFSSGEDVMTNTNQKLAKIHTKYDADFEYFLSRFVLNRNGDILQGVSLNQIDILFDTTPQQSAKEKQEQRTQTIQNAIALKTAGIVDTNEARNYLTNTGIENLVLEEQNKF